MVSARGDKVYFYSLKTISNFLLDFKSQNLILLKEVPQALLEVQLESICASI